MSNLDAYGVGWSFKSENSFNDSILNSKKMKLVDKNECRMLTKDLASDPDAFLCTGEWQIYEYKFSLEFKIFITFLYLR